MTRKHWETIVSYLDWLGGVIGCAIIWLAYFAYRWICG